MTATPTSISVSYCSCGVIFCDIFSHSLQLDEMSITFDGGITLNFAEAALLIQGTACIYSKKVCVFVCV